MLGNSIVVINSINGVFHFVSPLNTLMLQHSTSHYVDTAAFLVTCLPTGTFTHSLHKARPSILGLQLAFTVSDCILPVTLSW